MNPLSTVLQLLITFKLQMTIEAIKDIVTPILLKNKVKKAALFGSMASQSYSDESDVDILVELDESHSLLDFIGIKLELEDALHKKS